MLIDQIIPIEQQYSGILEAVCDCWFIVLNPLLETHHFFNQSCICNHKDTVSTEKQQCAGKKWECRQETVLNKQHLAPKANKTTHWMKVSF